jgi:adenylate cyclase
VIGDAVNLGSRLEGLCKVYGVDIVVSESTQLQAPDFVWQELDRVRVKGKAEAVSIFYPLAQDVAQNMALELKTWSSFLKAYRSQSWEQAETLLVNLIRMDHQKYLYQMYAERVASMQLLPFDPDWDGSTHFETK